MKIFYLKAIGIFIGALLLAVPVGMIFKNDAITLKTVSQNEPFVQTASAAKPKEEVKVETPAPIVEQTPAPAPEPVTPPAPVYVSGNCESYRPLVQKYFGDATESAMITMQKESSCIVDNVSDTNDYGLFQLNGMQIFDPEANIAAAYQKFIHPRRGTTPNWSAWYAVCTPNLVPKYSGIWCS